MTACHYSNSQNSMISFDYSWCLAKNLSHFVSLPWKLLNRYCHMHKHGFNYEQTLAHTYLITLFFFRPVGATPISCSTCIVDNVVQRLGTQPRSHCFIGGRLWNFLNPLSVISHGLRTHNCPFNLHPYFSRVPPRPDHQVSTLEKSGHGGTLEKTGCTLY